MSIQGLDRLAKMYAREAIKHALRRKSMKLSLIESAEITKAAVQLAKTDLRYLNWAKATQARIIELAKDIP